MNISKLDNQVAGARGERGWSQQELAARSGISRAEVSAIETGRLVPSTAAALRLAAAFGRTVEELFRLPGEGMAFWAIPPATTSGRFWKARVGSRILLFPVEPTALGTVAHDGTFCGESLTDASSPDWEQTLVLAGCDPAVGLIARELGRREGLRVIALTRGSREALGLLSRGIVHAAGIHWSEKLGVDANAGMVSRTLGTGFRLLHVARWQEGVALGSTVRARSMTALARSRIRWVGREEGSGARHLLDRILAQEARAKRFRYLASDHRGVAYAIRSGWAQAGVAVRLVAEEAGLDFLPVQQEDYELCYPESRRGEPQLRALRKVLRVAAVRRLFRDLPGYEIERMGEERAVA